MTTTLPPDAAARADHIEAAAFADLYAAAPASLAAQLGLQVAASEGATGLMAPAIPSAMFNRVVGLGLQVPAGDPQVQSWIDRYRAAGCTVWWMHWNPGARPAGFEERLRSLGFVQPPRRSWAKVMRVAEALAPHETPLAIGPAAASEAAATGDAIARAFEMPPFMAGWLAALHGRPGWTVYAARDGGHIVGGACLFVAGETAWLGMGSMLPSHRRRGGQLALMRQRITDAAAAGCRWVVTETGEPIGDESNPSLSNMKRTGFATVASRLNLEWRDRAGQ